VGYPIWHAPHGIRHEVSHGISHRVSHGISHRVSHWTFHGVCHGIPLGYSIGTTVNHPTLLPWGTVVRYLDAWYLLHPFRSRCSHFIWLMPALSRSAATCSRVSAPNSMSGQASLPSEKPSLEMFRAGFLNLPPPSMDLCAFIDRERGRERERFTCIRMDSHSVDVGFYSFVAIF
jgi:hypothetical protein